MKDPFDQKRGMFEGAHLSDALASGAGLVEHSDVADLMFEAVRVGFLNKVRQQVLL